MADVAKALAEAGTQGATQFGPFGRLALDPRKLSDVAAALYGMAKAPFAAAQDIQQNYRPGAENEIVNQDIGRQAFDAGSVIMGGAPMVEKRAVGALGGKPPRLDWDTPLPTHVETYGIHHDPAIPPLDKLSERAAQRFGVAPDAAEFPVIAATRYGDRVYTETIHGNSHPRAVADGVASANEISPHEAFGFLTNKGRFVTREGAHDLAKRIDEGFHSPDYAPGDRGFDSNDLARGKEARGEYFKLGDGGKPPRLDWDTPLPTRVDVYHGSTADVSGGIKPMARAKGQVPAISLATTEEQAIPFTHGMDGKPTPGSSITKGQLDASGFREVDWPSFAGAKGWNPRRWQQLLTELQDSGTPGALVRGMSDAGGAAPQYVVLDPSRFQQR